MHLKCTWRKNVIKSVNKNKCDSSHGIRVLVNAFESETKWRDKYKCYQKHSEIYYWRRIVKPREENSLSGVSEVKWVRCRCDADVVVVVDVDVDVVVVRSWCTKERAQKSKRIKLYIRFWISFGGSNHHLINENPLCNNEAWNSD